MDKRYTHLLFLMLHLQGIKGKKVNTSKGGDI